MPMDAMDAKRSLRSHRITGDSALTVEGANLIQAKCEPEILQLCGDEETAMLRLLKDGVHPHDVSEALLRVHQCLASQADELSQPCMASLVSTYLNSQLVEETPPASARRVRDGPFKHTEWRSPQPMRPADSDDQLHRDDRHEFNHQPHTQTADEKLSYYWENHGFGRNGGGAPMMRHHGGHHHHGTDGKPGCLSSVLLWVVVLPFFALGVYVAGKQAMTYYNKGQMPFAKRGTANYEPLKPRQHQRHEDEE